MYNYGILLVIAVIIIIFIWVIYFYPNNKNIDDFTMTAITMAPIPQNMVFVPCEGEYALCYYAKCKLRSDGSAECGCEEFDDISFVDVTSIIPDDVREETKEKCPYGLTSCPCINQAPVCDYVNSELTSTFSLGAPLFDFSGTKLCPAGKYANCMTAHCTRETAWDGSSVTCVCPVEDAVHTIANGANSCDLGENIIWSGVPV